MHAPWTIKGLPNEVRNAATSAAAREGLTIGAWMERAIRAQVQAEHKPRRALAVQVEPETPPVIPAGVFDVLDRACDIAHKLTGEQVPSRLRNQIMRVVHQHVRAVEARKAR